jgi:hypothetical protein
MLPLPVPAAPPDNPEIFSPPPDPVSHTRLAISSRPSTPTMPQIVNSAGRQRQEDHLARDHLLGVAEDRQSWAVLDVTEEQTVSSASPYRFLSPST